MTEGTDLSGRAMTPLSDRTLTELEQKNMDKGSPILIRLFKEEAELEVWKQDRTGHYALLKTYPICRWSGELGPKIREGDRQAPEGFYSITPAQMNPKSQYYLAFNIGYPNAYDRAWGRSGAELMIHGDCSSRGCYAMTDEQITEIYALGREAFFGGQRAFQVQAYPFRMTPTNFAKHRNNPNLAFWKMLKRGNDNFEVTRLEPKVDVCEKHYVFNAQAPANTSFNPSGKCPAYVVPEDITTAVNEKQRQDEFETAELITRGIRTSPIRTGTDGGMHPVFLAALQRQEVGAPDSPLRTAFVSPPGTIPATVVPPHAPDSAIATVTTAPPPAQAALPKGAMATARPMPLSTPTRTVNGSLFANARATATSRETTSAIAPAKAAEAAKPHPHHAIKPVLAAAPGAIRPKPAVVAAAPAKPPESKPAEVDRPSSAASLATNAVAGTAPMQPAGSFESRWSAITSRGRF